MHRSPSAADPQAAKHTAKVEAAKAPCEFTGAGLCLAAAVLALATACIQQRRTALLARSEHLRMACSLSISVKAGTAGLLAVKWQVQNS